MSSGLGEKAVLGEPLQEGRVPPGVRLRTALSDGRPSISAAAAVRGAAAAATTAGAPARLLWHPASELLGAVQKDLEQTKNVKYYFGGHKKPLEENIAVENRPHSRFSTPNC